MLRTLRAHSQQTDQELAESSFSLKVVDCFNEWSTEDQPTSFVTPAQIRHLLDPFRLLYRVKNLDIKGRVNKEYKAMIISSATQAEPTVAEFITSASAIMIRGDEAFDKDQFHLSRSLYTSAICDFQVNHLWGEYTGRVTGMFAGISTPHAVRLLRIRLHSNLTAALVKVGEYEEATEQAKKAIKHLAVAETPAEKWEGSIPKLLEPALPFFWGGMAWEGLGDLNRALYGVGEAMVYQPQNKEYAENYAKLEVEMEERGIVPDKHDYGKGTNWWTGGTN